MVVSNLFVKKSLIFKLCIGPASHPLTGEMLRGA
jgi:hypothetical protein